MEVNNSCFASALHFLAKEQGIRYEHLWGYPNREILPNLVLVFAIFFQFVAQPTVSIEILPCAIKRVGVCGLRSLM